MSGIGKCKNMLFFMALCVTAAIFAGCATAPVVEPTAAELNAAKKFKKTLAIVDMSSPGSEIEDIAEHAVARLENALVRHFNLVERRSIDTILAVLEYGSPITARQKCQEAGGLLLGYFIQHAGVQGIAIFKG